MTDIQVGSRVRVREPQRFVRWMEKKVENRVGTAERVFVPLGCHAGSTMVRVRFDPRRKGSPVFIETFRLNYLEVAE
jgi:hypothetical protein